MTLEELEENEDEFEEDDEAAIEMYRWAFIDWCKELHFSMHLYVEMLLNQQTGFQMFWDSTTKLRQTSEVGWNII